MKRFFSSLVLVLLAIASIALTGPFSAVPVYAIKGPDVLDPSNIWEPYGPRSLKLQFNFYAEEFSELVAFERGEFDVYDWTVPVSKWPLYENHPDFLITPPKGGFSFAPLDFNHESSDWTAWGCDFQNGNSPCGAEIRKALAHLVDRPRFAIDSVLGGAAQAIADPTAPAKIPPGSDLATQRAWDPMHATSTAYDIAPDAGGFASPGSPDFCAARDHLLAANSGFVDANNDCVIDNPPSTPIRYLIRSDSTPRRQLGLGHMAAINALFGTDIVAELLGNIIQLGDIVFVTQGRIDDWSMYTGLWQTGGPLTSHLQALYGSEFASNECGGKRTFSSGNYGFICVPEFDTRVDAAAQADNLATFVAETIAALNEFGKRALNIPIYSPAGSRSLALRDVEGLVNARDSGYSNIWTMMNGRASAYVPSNPTYTFGGTSGPDTLRWGQRSGTTRLNIFHAITLWDFNALGMIYDTLVRPSPVEPDKILSWMANSYRETVDASGNT